MVPSDRADRCLRPQSGNRVRLLVHPVLGSDLLGHDDGLDDEAGSLVIGEGGLPGPSAHRISSKG